MGKVAKWNAVRAKIKKRFERMGVTRCEICNAAFPLGFAHRRKRRHITDENELRVVALLCNPCHETIEYGGDMFNQINAIIDARQG